MLLLTVKILDKLIIENSLNKLQQIHQMKYSASIKYNEVGLYTYMDWYRNTAVLLSKKEKKKSKEQKNMWVYILCTQT